MIGRSANRLETFTAEGAESYVCDLTHSEALTKAFAGARAVYLMIPPNMISDDFRADQDKVTNAIAQAVEQAGVEYVVSLSSIGADKAEGTGPVAGLHYLEQLPDEQVRTALTQLGITLNVANLILELSAALNSGYVRALEERSEVNTTPTSYESFVAEEFVPRYRGMSTAT